VPDTASALTCSVIIPTYNRAGLLRRTLDSLLRQTLPRDRFEVLVVDDGSTDETSQLVARYRPLLNLRYFYQNDLGYRVAKARNTGIAHAEAEICVFIDSGVILHSECLQSHVDSHSSSAQPQAVCGYVYCFDQKNEDAALIEREIDYADPDATMESLRRHGRWLDIREAFYDKHTDDFGDLPAPWLVFWTCNVSARTAQLNAVGRFDEAYRSWGGEDIDLGYRLHQDGARFVLNRRAGSIHCPHPKDFAQHMRSADANYRYFIAKYPGPATRLLLGNHIFDINEMILAERVLTR
jgi:glycosyltransferase involved in cell wall biosynthesis